MSFDRMSIKFSSPKTFLKPSNIKITRQIKLTPNSSTKNTSKSNQFCFETTSTLTSAQPTSSHISTTTNTTNHCLTQHYNRNKNIRNSTLSKQIYLRLSALHKDLTLNKQAQLIKFDLSLLTVITCAGGYLLAGGSLFDIKTFSGLLIGSSLCASSAAIQNQINEASFDRVMKRTKRRPLPQSYIKLKDARKLGQVTLFSGAASLIMTTNVQTSAIGLGTIFTYVHIYTPMKRITPYNTEFGALVGSLPPLMGQLAAGSLTSFETLFLFTTLFTQQMHHFMAITQHYRDDYRRAGYKMISNEDKNGNFTLRKGVAYASIMGLLPIIACYYKLTNPMYLVSGTCVNSYLWIAYYRFQHKRTSYEARKATLAGIVQLMGLLVFLIFHLSDRDKYTAFREIAPLRAYGSQICLYLQTGMDKLFNRSKDQFSDVERR